MPGMPFKPTLDQIAKRVEHRDPIHPRFLEREDARIAEQTPAQRQERRAFLALPIEQQCEIVGTNRDVYYALHVSERSLPLVYASFRTLTSFYRKLRRDAGLDNVLLTVMRLVRAAPDTSHNEDILLRAILDSAHKLEVYQTKLRTAQIRPLASVKEVHNLLRGHPLANDALALRLLAIRPDAIDVLPVEMRTATVVNFVRSQKANGESLAAGPSNDGTVDTEAREEDEEESTCGDDDRQRQRQ